MEADSPVDLLMKRLHSGDQLAASEVFHRYSSQLIRLAQSRLNWRLQRKLDPEDVVQSAFRSFFRVHAQESLHFENWESLWGLLSLITIRKCGHRLEHFRAACRNIDRETPGLLNAAIDESRADWEAMSREPTPDQVALLTETLNGYLAGLTDRDRRIMTLCLQGYSIPDISQEVARSERTIRRVLERIEGELQGACRSSNE